MDYRESLLVGMEGVRTHKLRAFLSILGIIFGVGAVIAMLSIGEGAKQEALAQIQLMGMNNIIVEDTHKPEDDAGRKDDAPPPRLNIGDIRIIEEINPLFESTAPIYERSMFVSHGQKRIRTTIVGTTPEFATVMNYVPVEGSFISYSDMHDNWRVCALGSGIRKKLFLFRSPLGEQIKIGDQWFTVIGVMEDRVIPGAQKSDSPVQDLNSDIYIPLTASRRRFVQNPLDSEIKRVIVRVNDVNRIQEAANIIHSVLLRRHNRVENFSITVPEALLRQSMQTQRIFNIVMGAIAGISLLVGGIGIMNIMLASVLERTREIGIRRATGACRRDILMQFLLEAVFLSFAGGIAGIMLGFGLTKAIAMYANWRTIVSWNSVLLAFCVSVGIGIIFGVYPARRASRMKPIEALRYE